MKKARNSCNLFEKIRPGIFIGGLPMEDDKKNLEINKVNLIIGTFGRIMSHV